MAIGTIADEIAAFQRLLNQSMPWGGVVYLVDEHFEQRPTPGAVELLVSGATVLDASVGSAGTFYNVAFGPPDALGPYSEPGDESRPDAWTLLVTDPFVEFPDGRFALETLGPNGEPRSPESWVMCSPVASPRHLLALAEGVL